MNCVFTWARCSHRADGLPLVDAVDAEVLRVAGEPEDGVEPVGDVEEAVVGLTGDARVEEWRVDHGRDPDAAFPPRVLFTNPCSDSEQSLNIQGFPSACRPGLG